MKKKYSLLTLLILLLITFPLFSIEEEVKYNEIDFSAGLSLNYNTAKIKLGTEDNANSLFYPYLLLEINADIFDYLTIGVAGGYSQNTFTDPVDFSGLPLSLRLNKERRGGMVFGLNLKSEITAFGYFSLLGKAEFLYFKTLKNGKTIDLPTITGTADIKNSFYQLTVNLFLKYDGLTGITLFLGPEFNLLKGEISVNEVIEDIEAGQAVSFSQKQLFGLTSGINIDIGSHMELIMQAGFFTKTSFAAGLFYIF
jgi:hypothetical protein